MNIKQEHILDVILKAADTFILKYESEWQKEGLNIKDVVMCAIEEGISIGITRSIENSRLDREKAQEDVADWFKKNGKY